MRPTMIQRLAMAISLAASLVLPATVLAQSNCDEADFNQDGEVNGADLTILLGYWGPCPVPSIATVTGVVRLEGGVAVANASVASDLGGSTTSGADGSFALQVPLAPGATRATIFAVTSVSGFNFQGFRMADGLLAGTTTGIGMISVSAEGGRSCPDALAWLPGIGSPGITGCTNIRVGAMAMWNDGSGQKLFVGGKFTHAGSTAASSIARWNATTGGSTPAWTALGSGINGTVWALEVFNDGTGSALYAAGAFNQAGGVAASRIAKWNGSTWSPLGSGLDGTVHALEVFDDGTGPKLYAGGEFTTAGGVDAKYIAAWNGTTWSAVGGGTNNTVYALEVGSFAPAPAGSCIFSSCGSAGSCTTVHSTPGCSDATCCCIVCIYDPNCCSVSWDAACVSLAERRCGGPRLFVGGAFTSAGGSADNRRIASWNGTSWSGFGGGVNDTVYSIALFDDGSGVGPCLFVGGDFTSAGSLTKVNRIARWDTQNWSTLGTGLSSTCEALLVHDDGTGKALYAAGSFGTAGGVEAPRVARWNGAAWSGLGVGLSEGTSYALQTYAVDPIAVPSLVVGGTFTNSGKSVQSRIARWGCQTP